MSVTFVKYLKMLSNIISIVHPDLSFLTDSIAQFLGLELMVVDGLGLGKELSYELQCLYQENEMILYRKRLINTTLISTTSIITVHGQIICDHGPISMGPIFGYYCKNWCRNGYNFVSKSVQNILACKYIHPWV